MANLSDLIKSNSLKAEQSTVSDQFAMHALGRDDNGLLTYTKVLWNSSEEIPMNIGNGRAYAGVEEFVAGVTADGVPHNETRQIDSHSSTSTKTDTQHRKYEQVRFDHQKLTYFINSRGFLVARYVQDYSHTGPV